MKKPLLIAGLVVIAAATAFVFLKPSSKTLQGAQEKPLVIGFENDVVSFDTLRLGDVFGLRVASQIFEGLARLNENNEIVPGVAESWEHAPDFTKWTFKLRKGVRFHPHESLNETTRAVSAEDVIYSFTRMLSKDAVTAGPLASIILGAKAFQEGKTKAVEGLRIVSPETIEFTLVRPDALFPGRISSPAYGIVKQAVVEKVGADFGQTVGVGTGPFEFVQRQGNDLILRRYDGYWNGNTGPQNLVFRTVKEDTVRLAEAKAGRLDVTYATAPMLDGLVERNGGTLKIKTAASSSLAIQSFPIFNTNFLAFNWPKVDPDLRKAASLAVDRAQIVAAVAPVSGIAAAGPIPQACAGFQSKVTASRNLEASRAALAAFRARNPGVTPKLRILTHELAQSVPISEVIQSQFKEAGIEVEIVQQSFNAVVGLLQKGDFEAVVIGFEYAYSKPQLMLETYLTSAAIPIPNVFQYAKPENDAAIAALFTTGDDKASLGQSADVEKRLVDDIPGIFLFQTYQVILLNPAVQGTEFTGSNYPILTRTSRK